MIVLDLRFIVAYIIGGLTLLPICVLLILAHAYISFPIRDGSAGGSTQPDADLRRPGDDAQNLLSDRSAENLLDNFKGNHEHDVAAGYFAVCREYVPGGVNGRPPERVTPAGTVAGPESPSVYQSMYRTIFDRKQTPTMVTGKIEGKATKRSNNVFFIVLRHGHLMLYENSEQVEVKHVISLEHHRVGICAGGEELQEGELWIKRNALQLERKSRAGEDTTRPFFLFSENCSDKEDFYFALLEHQGLDRAPSDGLPQPLEYDSQHMIGLVQRLHSSEEQLQTRWLNGLLGRLFLALYKTAEVEEYIRQKITKKISRVQKPAFLTGIILRKIDVGNSAPQITNPKLRELTIHGDCCAEANIHYDGSFKIEVAATARLDLGARFRAREVDLVLAVVVKRLSGMLLVKFKPPPSNRMWISFERMPEMELSVEPIVSSRQITYGIILRAIQSRIREVIAETIVLPNWDDLPFADTSSHPYRGGIWSDQQTQVSSPANEVKIPDDTADDIIGLEINPDNSNITQTLKDTRTMNRPPSPNTDEEPMSNGDQSSGPAHSRDSSQGGAQRPEKPPKVLRSTSFAAVADPLLSNTNVDSVQHDIQRSSKGQKDATTSMMAISHRSKPELEDAPPSFASTDLPAPNSRARAKAYSSDIRSNAAKVGDAIVELSHKSGPKPESSFVAEAQMSEASKKSDRDIQDKDKVEAKYQAATKANRKSMATIGAASLAAKKWGWGVLSRTSDQNVDADPSRAGTPSNPIGRGQPFPPVGQPLPSPNGQRTSSMPLSTPQRKPLISSTPSRRSEQDKGIRRRKSSQATISTEQADQDGLLVVAAPLEELSRLDTDKDTTGRSEEPVHLYDSAAREGSIALRENSQTLTPGESSEPSEREPP